MCICIYTYIHTKKKSYHGYTENVYLDMGACSAQLGSLSLPFKVCCAICMFTCIYTVLVSSYMDLFYTQTNKCTLFKNIRARTAFTQF